MNESTKKFSREQVKALFRFRSEILRTVTTLCAICAMTGAIVYGGLVLRPRLAVSNPVSDISLAGGQEEPPLQFISSLGGGLVRPNAVAADGRGQVFVTDGGTGKVHVFAENGTRLAEFDGSEAKDGKFAFPNGILVADSGNLMVSDSVKNNIRLFSPAGKYLKTVLNMGQQGRPGLLYKDRDGMIWVSDLQNNRMLVMTEAGRILAYLTPAGKPLSFPQGVAKDRQGRLWVADAGSYALRVLQTGGIRPGESEDALTAGVNPAESDPADIKSAEVRTVTGGGNPKTPFSMVRGLVFDASGRAFAADTLLGQIRIFNEDGRQVGVYPSRQEGDRELVYPTGLSTDPSGKTLYVVDRGAQEIKVFSIATDGGRS